MDRLEERKKYYKSLVGKRLLLKNRKVSSIDIYIELIIIEISPSLRFLKLKFLSGGIHWETIEKFDGRYEITEILKGKEKK